MAASSRRPIWSAAALKPRRGRLETMMDSGIQIKRHSSRRTQLGQRQTKAARASRGGDRCSSERLWPLTEHAASSSRSGLDTMDSDDKTIVDSLDTAATLCGRAMGLEAVTPVSKVGLSSDSVISMRWG
ncbi:hypothetical protein M6B38_265335 [Iris pallida]|uniref:Uncharacterized protein n=1 Tax=Iris pallida TaxID=29817 RepID=A0AAX6IB26_IRIPA|nr:hypothetical protein M6B38_265335 [Iris pallida]